MRHEADVATAEDFRRATSTLPTERVLLPKLGKAVLLRRPTPMWFLFRGQFPSSLAARFNSSQASIDTVEDLKALASWMVPLLTEVFVEPRLAINPGPDEISPDMLDVEDVNFVIRWAVGEVTADGRDLVGFRGQSPSAAPSPSRGDLVVPTQ